MLSLLTPPVAFILVLLALLMLLWALGRFLSFRPQPGQEASSKPFACGEEGQPIVQPDYSQVFPFAFYFTVLHVVALMATTVPAYKGSEAGSPLGIALVYIIGAVIGLFVLYRR
jgi:NADH:ubiquinone oxidoreductase subunit 3 (subunit A)